MPIYEYSCDGCGKVSSFLVRSVEAHRTPSCPKCGTKGMSRVFSRFATGPKSSGSSRAASMGLPGEGGGMDEGPGGGNEPDLSALEGIDENDPRSLGRVLRKMAEESGEKMDPEMDEACRRLEAGEDPEAIEEAMGEALGGEGGAEGGGDDDKLYDA